MGRPKKILPNHAGLIDQRRNRLTKTLIGLYRSIESGIESDPDLPYVTVCEDHANCVCHETKSAAIAAMTVPDWCEDCGKIMLDRHAKEERDFFYTDYTDTVQCVKNDTHLKVCDNDGYCVVCGHH
jgi:hypothetical protein